MNNITDYIDETGVLITANVVKAGINKTALYKYLKENNYEKIAHGIYASPEAWTDENYALSVRYPQAVFSHDEALYYHGLVDREPMRQTITLYTGYGTKRLVDIGVKVFTVKKELLELGKIKGKTSFGHEIPIYNLERTICDLVRNRSSFEIQDFQTALKTYVLRKDKNLNLLMEYAKMFRIDNKIRSYMEVML